MLNRAWGWAVKGEIFTNPIGIISEVFLSLAVWYGLIVPLGYFGMKIRPWLGIVWIVLLWWRLREGSSPVRISWRKALGFTLVLVVILVLWCGLGGLFFDASTDGQGEYEHRILVTSGDYLPFSLVRPPHMGDWAFFHKWLTERTHEYPFCVTAWSVIYQISGNVEAGKGLVFFLACLVYLLWIEALKPWLKHRWQVYLLALFVVLNPVVVCQSLSYFTDSYVALFCSAAIAAILLMIGVTNSPTGAIPTVSSRHRIQLLVSSLLLLACSKDTGVVCVAFLLLSLAGATLLTSGTMVVLRKKQICLATVVLLFAGAYLMVNQAQTLGRVLPLVSSDLEKLAYSSSGNGIDRGASLFLGGRNKFEQLTMAIFNKARLNPDRPRWKWPFTVYASELMEFQSLPAEIRMGGFGPYFGPVWLLTLVGLCGLVVWGGERSLPLLWMIACLLVLSYLTPWWWARWNPWFWLIPILVVLAACQAEKQWMRSWLTGVLAGLIAVDILLVTLPYMRGAVLLRGVMRDQLAEWRTLPQPLPVQYGRDGALLHRLADYGITTTLAPGSHYDYQVRVRLACSGLALYTNDLSAPWVQDLITKTRQLQERMKQFHVGWVLIEVGDEVPPGLERNGPFGYKLKQ
jgi:hypothetical protein